MNRPNRVSLSIGLVYDDTLDRPGGVAQHIETLAAQLRAHGHTVMLLVGETREPAAGRRTLARNLSVRFNGNSLTIPLWTRAADLEEALAELTPDVLHVQLPCSPLMAGRLLSRAPVSTAVVGTAHVASNRVSAVLGARLLARISRRTHRRFDRVMAVSDPARAFAQRNLGMPIDAVVPNMVDVSGVRLAAATAWRGVVDDELIVFVGRLVPRKGAGRLLGALPGVLARRPRARAVIAGDGPLRARLERQARSLGMADRVEFLGEVDETTKAAVLGRADVACFPSLYGESFGIVLLEAMAAGAGAIVAGDNPGYRSVLRERPECLVNPNDPQALVEAIVRGLAESGGSELAHRWRSHLVADHDAPLVCERVLVEYERALHSRRGTRTATTRRVA